MILSELVSILFDINVQFACNYISFDSSGIILNVIQPLLCKILRVKSSHFNSNLCDCEFCVWKCYSYSSTNRQQNQQNAFCCRHISKISLKWNVYRLLTQTELVHPKIEWHFEKTVVMTNNIWPLLSLYGQNTFFKISPFTEESKNMRVNSQTFFFFFGESSLKVTDLNT